jgi:hypothetical protein
MDWFPAVISNTSTKGSQPGDSTQKPYPKDNERYRDFSSTTLFELPPTPQVSLTCKFHRRKIRASDWPNHLALPHRREAGWRGDGRRL